MHRSRAALSDPAPSRIVPNCVVTKVPSNRSRIAGPVLIDLPPDPSRFFETHAWLPAATGAERAHRQPDSLSLPVCSLVRGRPTRALGVSLRPILSMTSVLSFRNARPFCGFPRSGVTAARGAGARGPIVHNVRIEALADCLRGHAGRHQPPPRKRGQTSKAAKRPIIRNVPFSWFGFAFMNFFLNFLSPFLAIFFARKPPVASWALGGRCGQPYHIITLGKETARQPGPPRPEFQPT